jgi:hypothetical protein
MKYGDVRVHMWDTTDACRFKGVPTDAVFQRATRSEYYHGNGWKGGVGNTPGGQNFAAPLWNMGITDTDYMLKAGIFTSQQQLAEMDRGPPVANMTDKGAHFARPQQH